MDDNLKELLAQKKTQLKEKQKSADIQRYKDHFMKNIEQFSQKYRYADFSQISSLCGRDSWRSKKFAHIPIEMPTCAF